MRALHKVNDFYSSINYVAIYLRKSRNEDNEEDVLMKHRRQLVDYVEGFGWKYDVYQEVGSSDTIEYREEFVKLMERVQVGYYDAVVVIDFDRITKGDSYDYGRIKRMFAKANVPILTPYGEVIDLSDDTNVMHDMRATMGRYEYLQTKKRLYDGKLRSARLGNWVNGTPPLGYNYDRNTKKLVINEDEAEAVRVMFDLYVQEKKSLMEVGFQLNRLGYRTKRRRYFTVTSVQRLIKNQAYVGRIIYGKSEGSGHKNKKTKPLRYKDESEWLVVVDDAHPPIISKEVFQEADIIMNKRQRVPVKSRQSVYTLSGLVRCSQCNSMIRFAEKELVSSGRTLYVRKCQKANPFGERCTTEGINSLVLLHSINQNLKEYRDSLLKLQNNGLNDSVGRLKREIRATEGKIKHLEEGSERILSLFIEGMIDKQDMNDRTESQNERIQEARRKLRNLEVQLSKEANETVDWKIKRIDKIKKNFDFTDPFDKGINEALRELIDCIYYNKVDDNITIQVDFF